MANNALDLTVVANAKLIACVSTTTDDALFALLITRVSALIGTFLERNIAVASYDEFYPATDRQLLTLKNWPTQAIVQVTAQGVVLTDGSDFLHDAKDDDRGQLYMESGWSGTILATGLTLDPVARSRDIEVSYKAGYYLPNDPSYQPGIRFSLPLEISDACDTEVVRRYWEAKNRTIGVDSWKEGGYSVNLHKPTAMDDPNGLTEQTQAILRKYKRAVFA